MKYYEIDFNVSAPENEMQDARDLIAAMAGETGFETFEETDCGIKGYVQIQLLRREELDDMIRDFPMVNVSIGYAVKEAEYKDWNSEWEQEGFAPIIIDNKCCIHDGYNRPEKDYELSVEIDAKLAFGTGTHETTRMVISMLLGTATEGKNVLDCGCGTGILGIVALKLGAAKVIGYDIDEWSVDNSRHNALINHVSEKYVSLLGDASVLDTFPYSFDIVMANINRNILISDMSQFHKVMADDAIFIMSGFYNEDINVLENNARYLGLKLMAHASDGNWACLAFSKHKAQ